MPASNISEPHAGRVALVTGTSRGIGQAIAVGLAERGARVVLGDRGDASKTIALIADTGHQAVPVALDVSDRSSIEAASRRVAEELGHVDILVNNAGTFESSTWDDLDFDLWQRVMNVDLNGPMLMCKAFLPLMRGRGWGRVINIASATVAIASPVSIAYRTSKMGVIGFTRALSATLGDEGITINAVLPSLTRTAMTEGLPQAIVDASLGRQVIHREAEPADIAGASSCLPRTRPIGSPARRSWPTAETHSDSDRRKGRSPMRYIALEEAFSIPELAGHQSPRWPANRFSRRLLADWARKLPDFTEYRLPEMDAAGIDIQVLSLTVPGLQADIDAATARDDARFANDYLARVVAEHPDRFRGFAALPMQDPIAAAEELGRSVRELGFRGALVNDHLPGHYLD
jgi:NAD(P)-dependent dehydrogenase (short-subunit alcohol dehydrogenase family)